MANSIDLKRVTLSREELQALDRRERVLLVRIGGIGNELNILLKLILMSIRLNDISDVERKARLTRAIFLLQLLAGKTYEANKLLTRLFYRSQLSAQWWGDMPPALQEQMRDIKKYFKANDNAIATIRNQFAFHFDDIDVDVPLQSVADAYEIYFASATGNCLYYGSHVVAGVAMFRAVNEAAIDEAIGPVFLEVSGVAQTFVRVVDGLIHEIFRRNGFLANGVEVDALIVENVQDLDSVVLPFFVTHNRGSTD